MQVQCAQCGMSFERAACFVRRNKTGKCFCSVACQHAHSTRAIVDCERCGRPFTVKAYRVGIARYCSRLCRRSGETLHCETCGDKVYRAPSQTKGARVFCSADCAAEQTRFQTGGVPWNKGVKGLRLSPASEFKPGARPDMRHPIGSVSIRTRKRDGSRRAYVKVAHPNKWMLRAQLVWIAANGPIPRGRVIHHQNRDTLNDAIANLTLFSKSEHLAEHRHEFRTRGTV
jgi:hypothetical protein